MLRIDIAQPQLLDDSYQNQVETPGAEESTEIARAWIEAPQTSYSLAEIRLLEQQSFTSSNVVYQAPPREEEKVLLDLAQMALAIAGIFDPTPISDGADALLSILRGDWSGAGISVAGMVPYIGDLAKTGKLEKWAQTMELAWHDSKFANQMRPSLTKLQELLARVPLASLPDSLRVPVAALRTKLEELLTVIGRVNLPAIDCSPMSEPEVISFPSTLGKLRKNSRCDWS